MTVTLHNSAQIRADGIVRAGLVVYLNAADTFSYANVGNTWIDMSGSNKNANLKNTPAYTALYTDSNSGSILFNSLDSPQKWAEISYTQSNIYQFTVAAWIKTSNTSQQIIYQNRGLGATFSGKSLTFGLSPYLNAGGTLGTAANGRVFFAIDTDGVIASRYTNSSVNNGAWRYVVGVFSQLSGAVTASSFKIYVDGTEAVSGAASSQGSTSVPLTGLDNASIGWSPAFQSIDAGFGKINSRIGSLAIYERALSASEILQNYNATKGRYGL